MFKVVKFVLFVYRQLVYQFVHDSGTLTIAFTDLQKKRLVTFLKKESRQQGTKIPPSGHLQFIASVDDKSGSLSQQSHRVPSQTKELSGAF